LPICNPYLGSKDAQIALFDELASAHPFYCKKEIIGYSVLGKPIPMYRVGNPKGGKCLFDGAIHGGSDVSTIVLYHFLKWLLESGEPRAITLLQLHNILLIPIVNIDMCTRKNANGVDLNRNFPFDWENAGSPDPNSDYYRGPFPASEPETQAIIAILQKEQPEFYCNFHNWGGPWMASRNADSSQQRMNDLVASRYLALAQEMGVEPYSYTAQGLILAGSASCYSAYIGINSFVVELVDMSGNTYPNYNQYPTLEMIENYYWPRVKPWLITLAESCSCAPSTEKVAKIW
jgi:predicted deacylase